MKIRSNATLFGRVQFQDLKSGDCFRYPAGQQIYMKVSPQYSGKFNAVKLDDGCVYYICLSKEVVTVDVEAVVVEDC